MESLIQPTGVLQYNKEKAYDGYTLYSTVNSKTTFLIDMEGYIVHTWEHDTRAGRYVYMLENGNILRGGVREPQYTFLGGEGGVIQEIDWDGNIVWEYENYSPASCTHHSFWRKKNGNTLVLCWRHHSHEECLAHGRRAELLEEEGIMTRIGPVTGLYVSYFVEIDPSGKEVWRWDFWDHMGENDYHKLDFNLVIPVKSSWVDWDHCNNISYNEETNQIVTTLRALGEFIIIDCKSGDIVYRWGNPANYGAGRKPGFGDDGDQKLFGPHSPVWIGNDRILVYDNGYLRPLGSRSRIFEVDIKTGEIVWEWMSPSPNSFSSGNQSNVQRLPNGNTLMSACESGHIVEVSAGSSCSYGNTFVFIPEDAKKKAPAMPPSEVVWEYVNPMTGNGPKSLLVHATETVSGAWSNAMHRVFRYGKEFPGLNGKDLSKRRPFIPERPDGPWREYQNILSEQYGK